MNVVSVVPTPALLVAPLVCLPAAGVTADAELLENLHNRPIVVPVATSLGVFTMCRQTQLLKYFE